MTASPTAIDQSALDEGVRRVVVASSNHAADFYEPYILDGEVWPLVVVVLLLVLLHGTAGAVRLRFKTHSSPVPELVHTTQC